jgi:broad specificity phosphatase PhoE
MFMLLIRHAQSEWNEHFSRLRIDPGIPDPALTGEGVRQAEAAAAELARLGVRRLVTSPYRRTLQTAAIIARKLDVAIEVEVLVRERCAFSCDQGSPPDVLAREWPGLDFSRLETVWWGGLIESHASLEHRCAQFRERVAELADRDRVAVISHWGFIRCLTGHELANTAYVRLHPAVGRTDPREHH